MEFLKKKPIYLFAIFAIIICIGSVIFISGKDNNVGSDKTIEPTDSLLAEVTLEPTNESGVSTTEPSDVTVASTQVPVHTSEPTLEPTVTPTVKPLKTSEPIKAATAYPKPVITKNPDNGNILVAIDPGHQGKQNSDKEPVGPGSSVMKTKVAAGTSGVKSGVAEYVVTLQVSLKLRDILESKGYAVLMIRENHDVNISNAERAQIANNAGADIFVRVHCNGIDNSSVRGALTMCQTSSNPYCSNYYSQSRKLSENVINAICANTGLKNRGVSETDNMSGINWCQVPVTIVEMGFMSNPEEDMLLVDDTFQDKMALGIANGIDTYFGK